MISTLTRRVVAPGIAVALLLTSDRFPVRVVAQSPGYLPVPPIEETPGAYRGFTYVAPPPPPASRPLARTPTFTVTYVGLPPQAQAAFDYAVDIWGSVIQS